MTDNFEARNESYWATILGEFDRQAQTVHMLLTDNRITIHEAFSIHAKLIQKVAMSAADGATDLHPDSIDTLLPSIDSYKLYLRDRLNKPLPHIHQLTIWNELAQKGLIHPAVLGAMSINSESDDDDEKDAWLA